MSRSLYSADFYRTGAFNNVDASNQCTNYVFWHSISERQFCYDNFILRKRSLGIHYCHHNIIEQFLRHSFVFLLYIKNIYWRNWQVFLLTVNIGPPSQFLIFHLLNYCLISVFRLDQVGFYQTTVWGLHFGAYIINDSTHHLIVI